jgi:hypothetical protein
MIFPEGLNMSRFILRFKGQGTMPASDLAQIDAAPDVTVVDRSSRMLLVEAPAQAIHRLAEMLSDWTVGPERMIPLPEPRPKIR